jgi:thiamine-phosphate pyrophosphorylase
MFIVKKNYYFIIESIRDINLKEIKKSSRINIVYRSKNIENIEKLIKFRKSCQTKNIKFIISNNIKLMIMLKADGLYISANNKNLNTAKYKHSNYKIIGGAHNVKEINLKKKQGCTEIFFSRLFSTKYQHKRSFLGVVKFNFLKNARRESLIPLGGINLNNLNKLNMVKCNSIAISSLVKDYQNEAIKRFY